MQSATPGKWGLGPPEFRTEPLNPDPSKKYDAPFSLLVAWLGLALAYMGSMVVGATFHLIPPVLPMVLEDLNLNHGQGGLLMSLFALPGILLSLPGGWAVDRFGTRVVGGVGLLFMGLASLGMARACLFPVLLSARLLTGVGSVFAVLALQRLVTRMFEGRPLGLPMGVAGSAIPIGVVIIYNTAGPLAETAGWQEVAWRAGWTAVVVAGIFVVAPTFLLRRQRAAPLTAKERFAVVGPGSGSVSTWRQIWVAGGIWFLINGAMTAFLTFAPDHYLDRGFGVRERGLVSSLPLWASALMGLLVGWLVDRLGGKPVFIASGMGLMALGLGLVAFDGVSPLAIGLGLGVAMALVVTPVLSLPGELLPASHQGRGFGILSTCANTGIFILPPVTGWIRDGSGGYFWPFWMLAGLGLIGVLTSGHLVHLQKNRMRQ